MFKSNFSPISGNYEWTFVEEDYDYQQELARAGFADMLHDHERNRLYYAALKKAIKKMKSENKIVKVLDIGTGTGLLSMMAVRLGADTVTACEAFLPMVGIAKKCLKANNMYDNVKIIEKRSTDIKIGIDMNEKANILVTEVFDTELIGEGAINTFNHALKNLLEDECIVIPDHAFMYAQVVDSKLCHDWNYLNLNEFKIKIPTEYENIGGNVIYDVQLNELNEFTDISGPKLVFKFPFSGKEPLEYENQNIIEIVSKVHGKTHAVFMWWILFMDNDEEIILSCAPKWSHHTPDSIQWRDHWMQAVYFPSKHIEVHENEKFYLKCNHDEYSLWFDVFSKDQIDNNYNDCVNMKQPFAYSFVSRNRLAQINDTKRTNMFVELFKKYEDPDKNLFIFNDDLSFLALLAARMKFKHIFTCDSKPFRNSLLKRVINENQLENRITIFDKNPHEIDSTNLTNEKLDIIFTECAFSSAVLPWDNLYIVNCIKNLQKLKSENEIIVLPKIFKIYAIALNLENLYKIRSKIGQCEGFDLSEFDEVIENAKRKCDGLVEAHPLWEYPSYPMSDVYEIFTLDLDRYDDTNNIYSSTGSFETNENGHLNGIGIWYKLIYDAEDENMQINTGFSESPKRKTAIEWTKQYKQGVYFLDSKILSDDHNVVISYKASFDMKSSFFDLDFQVKI